MRRFLFGGGVLVGALSVAGGCTALTDLQGLSEGPSSASTPEAGPSIGDSASPSPTTDGSASDGADDGTAAPLDAAPDATFEAGTDAGSDAGSVESPYATAVLADSPLAYWRFGESTGTTAHDETGHGFAASVGGGATWGASGAITGDADTAIHLGSDGLSTGLNFDFAGTAPFTLEGWISPEVIDGTYRHLFSKNDENAAGGREEYGVYVQKSATLGFERYVAGASKTASAPLPPLNQYTYVVATYDGAALILYVNGVVSEAVADVRAQQPKPVVAFVGCKAVQTGVLQGSIDEVAIYDHALSPLRVVAHWSASGH